MPKKSSSKIKDNEILEDVIYVNDAEFKRYYHNNKIPTMYFASYDGRVFSGVSNTILKPGITMKGYEKYGIFINGKIKPVTAHKIIGIVYHPEGYGKSLDIDHIDGNKQNNRADNLEWVTRRENIIRAFKTGLKHGLKGNDNPVTVYRDEDIIRACELIKSGYSIVHVASIVKIPVSYLYTIIRGESRKDIVDKYKFDESIYEVKQDPLPLNIKLEIRKLYKEGYRPSDIMKKLNIAKTSRNRVYNTIHNSK